jgi:hypothetical protein
MRNVSINTTAPAGRGVTDYIIGGKKLINVLCGECPNVMCCDSTGDGGRETNLCGTAVYVSMHPWYKYILHFLVQCLYTSAFVLVAYTNYKYIESVLCVHVVDMHDVFHIRNF